MGGLDSIALAAARLQEAEESAEEESKRWAGASASVGKVTCIGGQSCEGKGSRSTKMMFGCMEESEPAVILQTKENDVLCGRGGETNHHPGNVRYRQLVKDHQLEYLRAKRRDKPKIARQIVDIVRSRGGRFLKKKKVDSKGAAGWRDVGNVKAREKTSQALRENAPEIRSGEPSLTHSTHPSHPNSPTKPTTRKRHTPHQTQLLLTPATVSSDDHDQTTSSDDTSSPLPLLHLHHHPSSLNHSLPFRGPRLKRLKARVVSDVC